MNVHRFSAFDQNKTKQNKQAKKKNGPDVLLQTSSRQAVVEDSHCRAEIDNPKEPCTSLTRHVSLKGNH